MRRIRPSLTAKQIESGIDAKRIASSEPILVKSFSQLVLEAARISYSNIDHLLFYRGQNADYKNKSESSTFYPSIYRSEYTMLSELKNKFDILEASSLALVEAIKESGLEGYNDVKKRKYIQWSILQHYEVCDTPLLDFTHSLRVACSFALLNNEGDFGYVSVFGLPYLTNRISYNSEHDLVNIRLLSICPPDAMRPYFQEGYLAATDDITWNYDRKTDLDFSNRLLGKFKIKTGNGFWDDGNRAIPNNFLFPPADPIFLLTEQLKKKVELELRAGDIGEFLKQWAEIEETIVSLVRKQTQRFMSLGEALNYLYNNQSISEELMYQIDTLRRFRNRIVHTPKKLSPIELNEYLFLLAQVLNEMPHLKRSAK